MSEEELVSSQRKSSRMSKGVPPKRYSPGIDDSGLLGENAVVSDNNQSGEMGTGTGRQSEKNSISSKSSHHSKKREQARRSAEYEEAKARAQLEDEEIQQQLEFQKRERERDQAEAELNRRAREVKKKLLEKELEAKLSKIEVTSDDSQSIGSEEDAEVLRLENDKIEVESLLSKCVEPEKPRDSGDSNFEPRKDPPKKERDRMDMLLSRQMLDKELPKFEGNPEEWPAFIAQFKQSTEDCQLSNAENMSRLRKSLKGMAKQTVQALMIMPQNVERVIATLEQRFGRPDYVVRALISKARSVPAPREEKWDSILDYANAVQNLVVTMESLKCQGHLMNPQLLEELVSKLPHHLKFEWGKKVDANMKGSTTLTEFSEWLGTVATAASWIHVPKFVSEEKQFKGGGKRRGREFRGDGTILIATEGSRDSNYSKHRCKGNTSLKCHFCERSNHLLKDCKEFVEASIADRRKLSFEKGLCFGCLNQGHVLQECRRKRRCNVGDCKSSHNPLLHDGHKESQVYDRSRSAISTSSTTFERVAHTSSPRDSIKVILRVIPVILKGPEGEVTSYALFDEAATVTLLDAEVAEQLGIRGPKEALCLQWTNEMSRREQDSQRVTVGISGVGKDDKPFKIHDVRTVKDLSLPVQSVDVDELGTRWPYLQGLDAHSLDSVRPKILIGQDNILLTTARKIVHGPFGAPVATKTWLGWTIHGPEGRRGRVDKNITLHICHVNENDPLHELVKESFSTEGFGVKITDDSCRSKEDRRAELIMDKTTKRLDEHFETGLLWKNENVQLPDSKTNAIRRLRCLEQKMDRNPEFGQQYEQKIKEYVEKGYARKLTKFEAEASGPRTWYLPHFAIQNPNKPGKLRIVFDAAAKSQGASLNDYLMKGPDLNSSLYGVLLRFRQKMIGFAGDIKEMFHQVRIIDSDLSSQRFLWRGTDRQKTPDTYEMQVMIFGAACSPSLAQYAKNKNAREFQDEFPEACKAIVERHFVDDYLDSADSEAEAVQLIKDVHEVHRRGGFEMRNWISSSKEVLKAVPSQDRSNEVKQFDLKTNLNPGRVLGLWWDAERDSFAFRLNFPKINVELIEGTKQPTKREVLKVVMSIFDPIGFLAPLIVKAKILLQDIWRCGVGWDDEITEDLYQRWIRWTQELKEIERVNIPRCYSPNLTTATRVELHVFCDASEKAFSAVAYLRISKEESIHTAFITARTRVSPLRPISIPRLELQGAVMASRLAKTIQKELEVNLADVYFWTDSKTVLSWIRADAKQFKPFVAHRIGEIQEVTEVYQWHWIPTKVNVADDATRDTKPCDFTPDSRWFCGPPFLKLQTSQWPTEKCLGADETTEEDPEIKAKFVAVTVEVSKVLPTVERFSKFLKLIRTTAWILRYCDNLKSRMRSNEVKKGELLPSEIETAEVLWWKHAQSESFPNEVGLLASKNELPKSSKIANLSPEMDSQGVIRLRGRNARAFQLSDSAKNPVILERKHPYTRLMIQYFHEKFGHHGLETILNELRQKFWVTSARSALKHAGTICQLCKVKKAHPKEPEMGQLPAARVTGFVAPFTYTGMDYFGPIDVTVGRRHEKRYGVLFTCLTIRAVHLEIANSLTTDACIMAIRRMIARRGAPKEIFSDNGTNLKGADTELKAALQELDQDKFTSEMSTRAIEWHFIPPSAPHMGGSWERLVRSVKIALHATLKERAPKEEVLHTLLLEAENIVNSRPLTHVSVDHRDPESLTPNHFLLGSSNGAKSPGAFSDHDLSLRSQWRQAQRLSDMFWNRWVREYLPTLSRRTKTLRPTEPVKIGDVVIIADNSGPRNTWPLGRVTATFPGRDGVIRVVNVKTNSGTYRRPVVKLCILDVQQEQESAEMMDAKEGRIIGGEDVADASEK